MALVPLLWLASPLAAQSVFVPLNHWSYEFVERLEAKGWITGVLNGTKPFSREEMVKYLMQAEERLQAGAVLSATEMEQLRFLRFEFQEEYRQLTGRDGEGYVPRLEKLRENTFVGKILPGFLYRNNRNLFSVELDNFRLFADPILFQTWTYAEADSLSRTEKVFERTNGFTIWGTLANRLGFFLDVRDTKEWGTRTYPNAFDISMEGLGFVNGYGSYIWHDETISYLVAGWPHVQIMFGKDFNYWGPGRFGALALSNNATSYDQLKLQARIWRLKFTYFWGFLRTYPVLRDATGKAREKNIVGHRLEIDVARWLDLAIYETVIFGNRRFELAYLNPINFYRSAEHFLGDNDNATLGFDVELLLIPNVKLYGELFIDDLFTSRIGTGWFGNKTAFLAGAFWVDAFTVPNLDLRLEYAQTRPYVYTHELDINRYTNFSTALGHWIGPNADVFNARLQYRFSKTLVASLDFETYRHGANEPDRNVGGDLNRPFEPGDPAYIDTFEGILERRARFGFQVSYELLRNLYVDFGLNTASSRNMPLPDGGRGPVSRQEVVFGLSLNR